MVNELARSRPAEVLLVEDNENDALLTRKGFERAKLMVNLHHVRDGEECMRFLRKQAEYADAPTPDMVLLDLNMPKMDGYEVLSQIVQDECLRHLPEVILTTSAEEREILDMYRLRCSSYIVKPVDFYQFLGAIRMIGDYWFTVVVLPTDTQPRDRG
jgi:two-component system, chemotaxis family, response regulator Rcp1